MHAREACVLSSAFALDDTDASDIARLFDRCPDYFLLQDGLPASPHDARQLFVDLPAAKEPIDQTVLGWKQAGDLYALVAILRDYPIEGTWYLGLLLVDSDWRGRGVGRSIYTAVENLAVSHGAGEIRLAVLEENYPGRQFWSALGFEPIRRVGPDTFKMRCHYRIELSRVIHHPTDCSDASVAGRLS